MAFLDSEVDATETWFASERFREITRLYSARQVVELTKVPYVSYFSFGEKLPVLRDPTSDPESMGDS